MKKKIVGIIAGSLIGLSTFTVASCSHPEVACASVVVDESFAKSGSGSGSSGGARSGGSGSGSSSKSSSGGSKSNGVSGGQSGTKSSPGGVSNSGSKSKPGAASGGTKPGQNGTPKTSAQNSASANSKANSKPAAADIATAKSEAPQRVTNGGSYYSSVTGNTYIYQPIGFYSSPGYIVDLYNPYDPWNYYYRPFSPYYGTRMIVASNCGDDAQEQEVKQETIVNITVDADGKVVADNTQGTTVGTTTGTIK